LRELVVEVRKRGVRVHVETNGTVGPLPETQCSFDWVVVSPKPPEYSVVPEWAGRVDELKLVVDRHLEAATVSRLAAAYPEAVVFLQPESGEDAAIGLCTAETSRYRDSCGRAVALVLEHPEWRLSLQVHKLLGIR
jgi:organic radical activating enzyme